jgi:hypothetical protein
LWVGGGTNNSKFARIVQDGSRVWFEQIDDQNHTERLIGQLAPIKGLVRDQGPYGVGKHSRLGRNAISAD